MFTSTNVETFACGTGTDVTVEEMTGIGLIKEISTAVFHQETLSVPKTAITNCITMLTARQEYYFPCTNHAMITTVLAVQSSR